MKKITTLFICMIIVIITIGYSQFVYAATNNTKNESTKAEEDWVHDSFSAAKSFLEEYKIEDDLEIVSPLLNIFKNIIKGVNMILIALLAGLSMISLSIVGVRYLATGAAPKQREKAIQSLQTVFIGMLIGFGAFTIFEIAMSVMSVIISGLA